MKRSPVCFRSITGWDPVLAASADSVLDEGRQALLERALALLGGVGHEELVLLAHVHEPEGLDLSA